MPLVSILNALIILHVRAESPLENMSITAHSIVMDMLMLLVQLFSCIVLIIMSLDRMRALHKIARIKIRMESQRRYNISDF